jgi:hypothetical protein
MPAAGSLYLGGKSMERIAQELLSVARELAAEEKVPAFIRKIERMTAQNDHNGAATLLAEELKLRKVVKVMEAIEVITQYDQGIPPNLRDIRYRALQYMWKEAKRKWGDEVGQMVYQAF